MAGIGDQIKSANENVSQWAKKTTSAMTEWWQEVNAVTNRRNKIRDLAREREKLIVEMGTKVYTLHRRDKVQNRDLLADCERVDTIAEDIDRIELEITEIKRRKAEAHTQEVAVIDDTPVVADEDIDAPAAGDADVEPEVADEGADAEASVEDEAEEGPTMEPAEVVEDTPEVEKEETVPCAHAQAAAEGPEDEEDSDASVECDNEEDTPGYD